MKIFTNPELLAPGVWKFVKVGGEYRFFDAEWKHTEAVHDGETASEGGTFCVMDDGSAILLDTHSISLKIYGVDVEGLAKALRRKVKR